MKLLLLGIVIAGVLIATVPAIRNAGRSSPTAPAIPAALPPWPAPSSPDEPPRNYRSPLGGNGGLGNASLAESEVGKIQVYTVSNLPPVRDGQVVRFRLSRPRYTAVLNEDTTYAISFVDQDLNGAGVRIAFPADGAAKLDLLQSHSQPGLSFYVALEVTGLRAVGRVWRPDSKTYAW